MWTRQTLVKQKVELYKKSQSQLKNSLKNGSITVTVTVTWKTSLSKCIKTQSHPTNELVKEVENKVITCCRVHDNVLLCNVRWLYLATIQLYKWWVSKQKWKVSAIATKLERTYSLIVWLQLIRVFIYLSLTDITN